MKKVDRQTARHYFWQEICDGWHLLEREDLSIIAEKMPPHTAEDMHYHTKSRQFFYILSGEAQMHVSDHTETLPARSGIEISPGEAHQMQNPTNSPIEFLVISMPKSHGDKILVE